MFIVSAIIFSLVGFGLSFLQLIRRLLTHRRFPWFTICLSLAIATCHLSLVSGIINEEKTSSLLRESCYWGKLFLFLLIALQTSYLFAIYQKVRNMLPDFTSFNRYLLRPTLIAITINCVYFYFFVTIGKSKHLKEMELFFVQSGYPAWLNYAIMVVECLLSIGLILHFKWKTGIFSAIGLGLIMIVAVLTHLRNNDPIGDVADAFMQLLNIALLIILYYLEIRLRNQKTVNISA